MEFISKNRIYGILFTLLSLGIVFLIFVSLQRTSTTKSEVKSQLENIYSDQILITNDTTSCAKKSDREGINTRADQIVKEQSLFSVRLYLITLGTALLIAFTSLCIGALIGFLFGIPRVRTVFNQYDSDIRPNLIFHNDNLVEISDWLTKIIVGVGLTQIAYVSELLDKLGDYLGPNFITTINNSKVSDSTKSLAISTVLYFLILGFLFFYLWTRFQFSRMIKESVKE